VKYTVELASGGMIYIQIFMATGSEIKLMLSLLSQERSRYSDWSSSPARVKNFLFSTSSRSGLGSTQPPIKWVPGGSFLGGKATEA
jgi:hypothetical protein